MEVLKVGVEDPGDQVPKALAVIRDLLAYQDPGDQKEKVAYQVTFYENKKAFCIISNL